MRWHAIGPYSGASACQKSRTTRSTARGRGFQAREDDARTGCRSCATRRRTPRAARREAAVHVTPPPPAAAPRLPSGPITAGRVVKWVFAAVGGWILLSLLLFMISAQIQRKNVVRRGARTRSAAAATR